MIYKMKLYSDSFEKIQFGSKTIEMRLSDEKRKAIKIGDFIEFTNNTTNEKILCEVVNLYKYKDFEELYKHHSKIAIGYLKDDINDPKDMLSYYSKEDIKKYGVLGIKIKLL